MREDDRGREDRPVLLELVGLAGSGKSTVFESLLAARPWIEPRPVLRTRRHALVAAREAVSVTATLVRRRGVRRATNPQDLKLMTYLEAIPHLLEEGSGGGRVVVFDQGPIFLLTRPRARDPRLASWWTRTFATWAARLDAVVWLDAPDNVLIDRINARPKWHALKGRPAAPAQEALRRTRATYEEALAQVESSPGGPPILRFDTSRDTQEAVVERILTLLETLRPAGTPRAGESGAAAASRRP